MRVKQSYGITRSSRRQRHGSTRLSTSERLLLEVEHRSGSLRRDHPYNIEDVPALATWLWKGPSESPSDRLALWRCSVLKGAFGEMQQLVSCKADW
jgi:hypothetical protein